MRTKIFLLGGSALTILASPALAQTPQEGETPPPSTTAPARSTSYDSNYFAKFAPRTALDMVQRLPGFSLDLGDTNLRGFSGTAGNVVIDGQRPSSKSDTIDTVLARIPASRVARIDVSSGDAYGAEYAGKAQVANVILKAGAESAGGLSGTATVSGERSFNGHINPNAALSVQYTKGPSTFSLSGDTQRFDLFEKGYDRLTDAQTGEEVEFRRKYNRIYDHNPYISGSWALDTGNDRSMHLNARYQPSDFYLRQSNHVTPAGGPERDDALHQDYSTDIIELGGDITRPLAGGAIKLVALSNNRKRETFDDYLVRGLGGAPILGGFEQLTDSKLGESIAKLSWSKPKLFGLSFETGAEVAYNKLDYALDLFEFDETGDRTQIDLPIEDATVSELRGEAFVNAGRSLSKTLRADVGMRYEVSRLKVRGDATADRSLKFWKPSLTLDWQPGNDWHGQLILRRTVAQLDFYDFVSAAELSNDRVNGGNANLEPQRSWQARLVAERPLLKTGKARLEVGHDIVQKLQDRILVFDDDGNAFDAPGNLGTGRRWFADLTLDAPLDNLWKGLRVKLHGNVQKTRVKDPIWGDDRRWSDYYPNWQWDAEFRRDAGRWAYGFTLTDRDRFYNFRTDTIDSMPNIGPYAFGFVEYRPSATSSLRLNLENILDTAGAVDRAFYFPNRTDPVPDLFEYRKRNGHLRLMLQFKKSFGGGAK